MIDDIAILIPAYNEAKTILNVITPLLNTTPHIIVVDDGSSDNTANILSNLKITLLKHASNQGKGASLQTGFAYLAGKKLRGVITLDADGQHNPQDILTFISALKQHPTHLIIGSRQDRQIKAPKYRYYANQMADFLISKVMHQPIVDSQSGFRFYPYSLINQNIQSRYKKFGYEIILLIMAKKNQINITHVHIETRYPKHSRKSYFSPVQDSLIILFILITAFIRI